MLKNRIIALRYSAPIDYPEGKMSYQIALGKCYDLALLNQKARNGVKRGLELFRVEEISFERLAGEGWILQEDTLIRQKRKGSMTRKQWELLCLSAKDLQGFHAFAATCNGELAGAVIVCRIDDMYTVPYALSHCRFLQNHVNNALFFSISCDLLKRENVQGIFFTVQSLDAPPKLDEFKLRMGFDPKMVLQNVVFNPYLKPLITPAIYSLNRKLLMQFPSNSLLAKSEGMIRFHLEGRRPVNEQIWPDCIQDLAGRSDRGLRAG